MLRPCYKRTPRLSGTFRSSSPASRGSMVSISHPQGLVLRLLPHSGHMPAHSGTHSGIRGISETSACLIASLASRLLVSSIQNSGISSSSTTFCRRSDEPAPRSPLTGKYSSSRAVLRVLTDGARQRAHSLRPSPEISENRRMPRSVRMSLTTPEIPWNPPPSETMASSSIEKTRVAPTSPERRAATL